MVTLTSKCHSKTVRKYYSGQKWLLGGFYWYLLGLWQWLSFHCHLRDLWTKLLIMHWVHFLNNNIKVSPKVILRIKSDDIDESHGMWIMFSINIIIVKSDPHSWLLCSFRPYRSRIQDEIKGTRYLLGKTPVKENGAGEPSDSDSGLTCVEAGGGKEDCIGNI